MQQQAFVAQWIEQEPSNLLDQPCIGLYLQAYIGAKTPSYNNRATSIQKTQTRWPVRSRLAGKLVEQKYLEVQLDSFVQATNPGFQLGPSVSGLC
jgi:hypothetical protein